MITLLILSCHHHRDCTRIDYAIATMPELAILGYSFDSKFSQLRRSLIGNPTVPQSFSNPSAEWGQTCNDLLQSIWSHESRASKAYYYKNHYQYFDAIYKSLKQIRRVLIAKGQCVLVVQDSYYKDIHNDLPQIFIEMADCLGLRLSDRHDFPFTKSFRQINPGRRLYKRHTRTTESVLCFVNEEGNGSNDQRPKCC